MLLVAGYGRRHAENALWPWKRGLALPLSTVNVQLATSNIISFSTRNP
jgi:hypothetical protein